MIKFDLHEALDNRGMTMTKLSELTGIGRPTLSKLANGQSQGIQFDTLEKIALTLNVPLTELLKFVSDANSEPIGLLGVVQYDVASTSTTLQPNEKQYGVIVFYEQSLQRFTNIIPLALTVTVDSQAQRITANKSGVLRYSGFIDDAMLLFDHMNEDAELGTIRILQNDRLSYTVIKNIMGRDEPLEESYRLWLESDFIKIIESLELPEIVSVKSAEFSHPFRWESLSEETKKIVTSSMNKTDLMKFVNPEVINYRYPRVEVDSSGAFHFQNEKKMVALNTTLRYTFHGNKLGNLSTKYDVSNDFQRPSVPRPGNFTQSCLIEND